MAAGAGMQFATLARAKTLAISVLAIRHVIAPVIALTLSLLFKLSPVQATVLLMFGPAGSPYSLRSCGAWGLTVVLWRVWSRCHPLLGVLSLPFALSLIN